MVQWTMLRSQEDQEEDQEVQILEELLLPEEMEMIHLLLLHKGFLVEVNCPVPILVILEAAEVVVQQ